jgi:hypothetical protein
MAAPPRRWAELRAIWLAGKLQVIADARCSGDKAEVVLDSGEAAREEVVA